MKISKAMEILHRFRFAAALAMALLAAGQSHADPTDCAQYNIIALEVDTLPKLNLARTGHTAMWLNGEAVVFGGHTDGFVITPTAEYLRDGKWHTVPLAYAHDAGIALKLRSARCFWPVDTRKTWA